MRSFEKIETYKHQIEDLYRSGLSIRDVSNKLGLSKSTVGDYIRSLNISRNDFTGDKNPFFGKKHTEETLQSISSKNKGRPSVNKNVSKYPHTKYINGLVVHKWQHDARVRDIVWNISNEQIDCIWEKQDGLCALTGRPMHGKWRGTKFDRVSLDRIDSNKDYNIGNCQLTLGIVNICKHTLGNDDFKQLCKDVVDYAAKKT